ncbi:acyl-CoA synthetase family protein [Epilithonimonas tenax]|uniref:AMP-binding protein n=1 Tax=Epilithonimonas tenax TaxID=191577 RepID=UPI0003FB7522|nr:AMP-binding protein [Epilithonimonas tenax]
MLINLSLPSPLHQIPSNEFETKVLDFIKEWFSDSKTVQIQSSGSTGTPKIFEVEKSKMWNSARMTCQFLDLKEGNSALICLPIEYISGKMMVVRSILRKLNLKITEPSTNPLQNNTSKIDFCAMTPLQVENSLGELHLIKNLIIGGAAVSETLKNKIIHTLQSTNTQTKIFETYGMSETLSHIALKQIFPNQEDWFTVFEGVEIDLDESKCLKISAPKLNAEVLQTNDLVEIKDNKQFRFLGRIDHVINSAGAKIFPEELEKLVKQYLPNEVVFLGIDDEKLGQKLILVVEGQESDAIHDQLASIPYKKSFHQPKDIIFVEQIPRTENGKVSRLELKRMIESKTC